MSWQHMYTIRHSIDHLRKAMCYSLNLSCSCPMRMRHINKRSEDQHYEISYTSMVAKIMLDYTQTTLLALVVWGTSQIVGHNRLKRSRSIQSQLKCPTLHRTGSTGPQVLRPSDQSIKPQPLRAWKLGLPTIHGFPSPRSQVRHECLHGHIFWRWGFGTCVESWVAQKARPNSQYKSRELLCIKQSRFDFNGYRLYFNEFLRLKSWDFASKLILVDKNGTWDPMWTSP